MTLPGDSARAIDIRAVTRDGIDERKDLLAVEEPMEVRLGFGPPDARQARSLSITMRTPGHDFELAVGFLFTEGIVREPREIQDVTFCGPAAPGRDTSNIVRVDLDPDVRPDVKRLERHFYTTSSCGICGKASLDALEVQGIAPLPAATPTWTVDSIHALPAALRAAQPVFERTGGLHAAALADRRGRLSLLREDVGRHNAVDKLIGRCFQELCTPLSDSALVLSGRASFEILQKALVAGIPAIVAVGAPSSLAADLARRHGMTLIGFTSAERFNVYAGAGRLIDGSRVPGSSGNRKSGQ